MTVRAGHPRRTAAVTGALTAAAAASAGVSIALWNVVGLAAVLGVLTLALAARVEAKTVAVVGLLGVLMSMTFEVASGWQAATYSDEVIIAYLGVVLVGRRLLQRRALFRPPGTWMFVLFAVLGAISSVVSSVPLGIAAAGCVLVVKGALLYFALAQLDWSVADIGWLTRAATWTLGIVLACGLINLAVPTAWSAVFSNTGHPQYRSILPSLTGPFTHPLQFGGFTAMAAIACATVLMFRSGQRAGSAKGLLLASVLATVLSFRRTAIVGLLAALSFLALRRRHASVMITTLLLLPIAAITLYPIVQQVAVSTYDSVVVDWEENARTRMTVDSVSLALEHFPLGVGFGRFGSAIAREDYSPEYVRLGYDSVYGLGSPGNPHNHGRFLTDTQWPEIVGEAGLVGASFFVAGLVGIVMTFRRASRAAHPGLRLLGVTGLGWSVHILLTSVAYPVYIITPTAPLLFGLGAITAVMVARQAAEQSSGATAAEETVGDGGQAPVPAAEPSNGKRAGAYRYRQ
jgi:hypothetical protein